MLKEKWDKESIGKIRGSYGELELFITRLREFPQNQRIEL